MSANRIEAARLYLISLAQRYENIEAERLRLLNAEARIIAINAEKADLLTDAQAALDKFNALSGTSYTLAQVRAWLSPPP